MLLHPVVKAIAERRSRVDKALRAGNLSSQVLREDFAFIYKDGDRPEIGFARSGAASPGEADDSVHAIPFTITTADEDRDGDIVVPSGCQLGNYSGNPCVFFGHQAWEVPIAKCRAPDGRITVFPEENRVRAVVYFDGEDEDAMLIYGKVKRGFLNATSVAFVPIEAYRREAHERKYLEEDKARTHNQPLMPPGWLFKVWDMTELSIVGVPSNAGALRDIFDSEKSYMSPRLQKAWQPYCAVTKGCWNGWCPCPPCDAKPPMSKSHSCGCGNCKSGKLCVCNASSLKQKSVKKAADRVEQMADGKWYTMQGNRSVGGPFPDRASAERMLKVQQSPYDRDRNKQATQADIETGKPPSTLPKAQPSDEISADKACQILRDGEANGKPLTEDQRRMFGAACGRSKKSWGGLRDLCRALTKQPNYPTRMQVQNYFDKLRSAGRSTSEAVRLTEQGMQVRNLKVTSDGSVVNFDKSLRKGDKIAETRLSESLSAGTGAGEEGVGLSEVSGTSGGYLANSGGFDEEAATEGETEAEGYNRCGGCDGTGNCENCEGTGLLQDEEHEGQDCPDCGGSGDCPDCGGRGNVIKKGTGTYHCRNCNFSTESLEQANQHERENPGHSIAKSLKGKPMTAKNARKAPTRAKTAKPVVKKPVTKEPDPNLPEDEENKAAVDEPFEPVGGKHSAVTLAKLYSHYKAVDDYIDQELKKMDHPGVEAHLQEHKGIVAKAMQHVKDGLEEHHPDVDLDEMVKGLETSGSSGTETGEENKVEHGEVPPDSTDNEPPPEESAEPFAGEETPEEEAAEGHEDDKAIGSDVDAKVCPSCGNDVPAGETACPACGAAVKELTNEGNPEELKEGEGATADKVDEVPAPYNKATDADPDAEEILERYQTAKGWKTRKAGTLRKTKSGYYLVRHKDNLKLQTCQECGALTPPGKPCEKCGAMVKDLANMGNPAEQAPGEHGANEGQIVRPDPAPTDDHLNVIKDAADHMDTVTEDDAVPKYHHSALKLHAKALRGVYKDLTDQGKVEETNGAGAPLANEGNPAELKSKSDKAKSKIDPAVVAEYAALKRAFKQNGILN